MFRQLLLLFVLATAPGCPKGSSSTGQPPAQIQQLVGTWRDEGGTTYKIVTAKGALHITEIIDSDDERFLLREEGWKGGHFGWTYFVPSTEYVVSVTVERIDGATIHTSWSNNHGMAGVEEMYRE